MADRDDLPASAAPPPETDEIWLAARLQALIDATASIVWTADAEGAFRAPQRSWERYTGQSWDEHRGFGWADALHADDRGRIRQAWAKSSAEGRHYVSTGRLWHAASQSYRHFEARAVPVRDEADRIREWVGMCIDIESHVRLEEDRQRLATLVENTTDFVGICDLEMRPLFVNRAGFEMVGLDEHDLPEDLEVDDFFFPEDRKRVREEFFPHVLEHGDGEIEVRFRHFRTGRALWMLYRVIRLDDATGEPTGLATISRDITERRFLEDDLREMAADLAEANRRKSEFLAVLAHELRNPLAPIRNALEILGRREQEESDRLAHEMMERQVSHLTRLVDDLLDISRISRGTIELRREPVALQDVLRSAEETSRPLLQSARQQLELSLPAEPLVAEVDPMRVAQAVGNLLNNASKFSAEASTIRLALEREEEDAVVTVRDQGRGIAPDDLPHIFELFRQADSSLERTAQGLGVGLALVQTLVELHGGSVNASSPGSGRGSEFEIRLPLAAGSVATAPPPPRSRRATSPLRILVADDNRDSAESLSALLEASGHQVRVAHDGRRAIQIAGDFEPEVVLLDIGMPEMNGYRAARQLRGERGGSEIVLIAITGWGAEEDLAESRAAGFDGHLVKPVDFAQLEELIAELTGASS